MKKAKKIIALISAFAISAGMLAGCGGNDDGGGEMKDGVYTPKKELGLTVWNLQGTEHIPQDTSSENIPKSWLEEKSKVRVANIYGNDGGQWDTKLTRLIAGDSLPDIVYVAAGQGPSHFKKLKDAKKLYPLTEELIKEYAPNVWSRVPEDCWDAMTIDGEILGIPFGFSKYDEQTHPFAKPEELEALKEANEKIVTNFMPLHIRDDIARMLFDDIKSYDEMAKIIDETGEALGDNASIFPIETTEDYIKLIRDIDALNLKENGKKVFAFGYDGGDLWMPLTYLGASMYGYTTNNYITMWNPVKKQIEAPLLGDVVKQAAKTQNEFIREGIFDPESLVQNNTTFKENCLNGLYAITSLDYCGGMINVNAQLEQLGKKFRYIPLRVKVKQSEETPIQYYQSRWTAALAITDKMNDAQVKQILNWINIQFSDEFEEILWWGRPEDDLYTEENGIRKYKDDRFNKRYIEGDNTALSVADCRGIGSAVITPEAEFYVLEGFLADNSHWNPRIMQGINTYKSSMNSAWMPVKSDENAKKCPQSNVYDAPYTQIDECVVLWAKREQWESPFKIALGSDSEESFEKQWSEAEENLKSITDIDAMCEKMTEIAREEAKSMGIE